MINSLTKFVFLSILSTFLTVANASDKESGDARVGVIETFQNMSDVSVLGANISYELVNTSTQGSGQSQITMFTYLLTSSFETSSNNVTGKTGAILSLASDWSKKFCKEKYDFFGMNFFPKTELSSDKLRCPCEKVKISFQFQCIGKMNK